MAGQKIDVILGILIHASSFWNDIADELMIFLQPSFLIGYVRITVKNLCPPGAGFILLYIPWVFKFRTVVGEDDREVLLKRSYSYGIAEIVDSIDYAFLCTVWEQNKDHERTVSE